MEGFFYLGLFWILLSRIVFQSGLVGKEGLTVRKMMVKTAIESLAVCLISVSLTSGFMVLLIILLNLAGFRIEHKAHGKWKNILHFIIFLCYFTGFRLLLFKAGILFEVIQPLWFIDRFLRVGDAITALFDKLPNHIFALFLCGFLFQVYEANCLILQILVGFKIVKPDKKAFNQEELRKGMLIGILERGIIFLLIVNNGLEAIGFVLAAKAFARYKKLDDKDFAEYILIGTFLSGGLSALMGIFCQLLIKI